MSEQASKSNNVFVSEDTSRWNLRKLWQWIKSRTRRQLIIAGVAILVLVVAGVVAGTLNYRSRHKPLTFAQKITNVDSTTLDGDYASATKQLLAQKPATTEDQLVIWSRLAAIDYDQGKYADALTYYQKMLTKDPNNRLTLENAGDTAGYSNKKSEAAQYYQKAIAVLQKNQKSDILYKSDLASLQAKLKAVQS